MDAELERRLAQARAQVALDRRLLREGAGRRRAQQAEAQRAVELIREIVTRAEALGNAARERSSKPAAAAADVTRLR